MTAMMAALLFSACQSSPAEVSPSPNTTPASEPSSQTSENQVPQTPNSHTPSPYSDVTIESPDLSKPLQSPVTIKGKIDGSFFFEGTFPVALQTEGKILAETTAQADDEWTKDVVPFHVTLTFEKPKTSTGTLILLNDNPSGLPENDKVREFPVIFN